MTTCKALTHIVWLPSTKVVTVYGPAGSLSRVGIFFVLLLNLCQYDRGKGIADCFLR